MNSPEPIRRRRLLTFAIVLLLVMPYNTAAADESGQPVDSQIVAGPGGFVFAGTYYTPAMAMLEGGQATFTNTDIALHDVVSRDRRPDGRPLFSSALIGLGTQTKVRDTETVPQGVYEFYCSLHPWMVGRLAVGPNPTGEPEPEPTPTPTPEPTPTSEPTDPEPTEEPTNDPGAAGWPMFGRDVSNSRATDDGPAPDEVLGLTKAWSYVSDGEGDFAGTPAIGGGRVYMPSSLGRVVALDQATGELAWKVNLNTDQETAISTASAAYDDGVVYVPVSARGNGLKPYVVALDAATGAERWRTYVDSEQPLGDLYGSPVVWETTGPDGQPFKALYIGTSSWDSGGSGADELHLGTTVALDLNDGGRLLWRTYMYEGGPHTKAEIPVNPATGKLYDGAAVWSTPTIDTARGHVFVGTGNGYESRHKLTGSIVKLDAFTGEMLDNYQATQSDSWKLTTPTNGVDADFGAAPQLVTGPNGELWIGGGQKNNHLFEETTGSNQANTMAGLARYHMVDRTTMEAVWVTAVGPGYWWGGITGATAYDGQRVYGSTVWGQLFALDKADGSLEWMTAAGDVVAHMAHTQVANGVVYSADAKGFVTAFDAALGAPLWTSRLDAVAPSAGGVAVVGDTVFVAQGLTTDTGSISAFKVP